MFDLKYLTIVNAVRKNADQLNDYSKLKDRLKDKEDYESLYYDLMNKYNIDIETYTIIRVHIMNCDTYFKDYNESFCYKKLNYMRRNFWNRRNEEQTMCV